MVADFCQASAERGREAREQCGTARPYSFVVHGLWPQYERGFPRDCQVPAPRLNREIMSSMLDLMPAPRLVYHQWDKHGTCCGLDAQAYFDLVRKARSAVKIPDSLRGAQGADHGRPRRGRGGVRQGQSRPVAQRHRGDLRQHAAGEVRICMSKDLKFRDCAEIDRRACRRDKLIMPPVRGGELIRRTSLSEPCEQHRLQLRAQRTELAQRAGLIDPGHGRHGVVAKPVHVAVEFAQRTLERRRALGVEARMPPA